MTREYLPKFSVGLGVTQPVEPNITFYAGDVSMEVMRIDKHGVKVNPAFTVDEATQHVLNALTAHIQHTINHAVAAEREACAKVCDVEAEFCGSNGRKDAVGTLCAAAIRARSNT